jgi:adenosylmethionine-8-amino-7-oxononanoate aminotransferase
MWPAALPDFARRYARHALAQGVLLRPIGSTLYAMPPYVISRPRANTWRPARWPHSRRRWPEEAAGRPPTQGEVDGV